MSRPLGILLPLVILFGLAPLRGDDGPQLPKAAPAQNPADFALLTAAAKGDLPGITNALGMGANLACTDADTGTPLIYAVINNHLDAVKLLIARGANVNTASRMNTPLEYACDADYRDIALALLDAGASTLPGAADPKNEEPPLDKAAKNDDIPLMQALLDHHADINYANNRGTALSFTVESSQHKDGLAFLVSKGADINLASTSAKGWNPLLKVARSTWDDDHVSAEMETLLKLGANPNARSKPGYTALMCLCDGPESYPQSIGVLLDAGADINATLPGTSETALTIAGSRGHDDIVALLKAKGATRTDIHIVARQLPNPPPSPAHAWALALGAMYDLARGWNFYLIGEPRRPSGEAGRNDMVYSWHIHNAQEFNTQLDYLQSTGERDDLVKEGKRLNGLSWWAGFIDWLSTPEYDLAKRRATIHTYQKWGDRSGLAYDLASAVLLVEDGHASGYLSDEEAWARLLVIARQAQKNFHSWQEFGDNYIDGRTVLRDDYDMAELTSCVHLLSNPQDPNSPWNQYPWDTDLSGN